jgi:hypothetical protein
MYPFFISRTPTTCPIHPILLELTKIILFCEEYKFACDRHIMKTAQFHSLSLILQVAGLSWRVNTSPTGVSKFGGVRNIHNDNFISEATRRLFQQLSFSLIAENPLRNILILTSEGQEYSN